MENLGANTAAANVTKGTPVSDGGRSGPTAGEARLSGIRDI